MDHYSFLFLFSVFVFKLLVMLDVDENEKPLLFLYNAYFDKESGERDMLHSLKAGTKLSNLKVRFLAFVSIGCSRCYFKKINK